MAKDKQDQPDPQDQPAAAPAGPVQVRVLVDHFGEPELRCDTVVTLDADTAAALKREGIVDDDPAAVAACGG